MQDSLLGDDDDQHNSLVLNTAFCNQSITQPSQISTVFNDRSTTFNEARSALNWQQPQVQLAVKNFPTEHGRRWQHRCFICGQQDHEAKDCKLSKCYFCGAVGCECTNLSQLRYVYEQQCFRCGQSKHTGATCNVPLKSVRSPFCVYCGISGHSVRYCGIFKRVTSRKMPIFTAGNVGPKQSEREQLVKSIQDNASVSQQKKKNNRYTKNDSPRFQEKGDQPGYVLLKSKQLQDFFEERRRDPFKDSRSRRK